MQITTKRSSSNNRSSFSHVSHLSSHCPFKKHWSSALSKYFSISKFFFILMKFCFHRSFIFFGYAPDDVKLFIEAWLLKHFTFIFLSNLSLGYQAGSYFVVWLYVAYPLFSFFFFFLISDLANVLNFLDLFWLSERFRFFFLLLCVWGCEKRKQRTTFRQWISFFLRNSENISVDITSPLNLQYLSNLGRCNLQKQKNVVFVSFLEY